MPIVRMNGDAEFGAIVDMPLNVPAFAAAIAGDVGGSRRHRGGPGASADNGGEGGLGHDLGICLHEILSLSVAGSSRSHATGGAG